MSTQNNKQIMAEVMDTHKEWATNSKANAGLTTGKSRQ